MAGGRDFLEELIAERRSRNPAFPELVEAARERRRILRRLAGERSKLGFTQTEVAALMGTSQSSVARIESGSADVKLSTVERYAASLGRKIEWRLAATKSSRDSSRRRAKTA
jgi:DNA-binding XRE family transcriptional regulator